MTRQPPTVAEVLADYGIDSDQLVEKESRGKFLCPGNCMKSFKLGRDLSRHYSHQHGESIMETYAKEQSYEGAWEDALTELVTERGYSLSKIGAALPTHTGTRKVRDDAEKYGIEYEDHVAGGPNSKLQHYKPEELGLSPIGEVK